MLTVDKVLVLLIVVVSPLGKVKEVLPGAKVPLMVSVPPVPRLLKVLCAEVIVASEGIVSAAAFEICKVVTV